MDGASFSPHLVEDDKGYRHLDAPSYWLCPVTWLEQAGYADHNHHPLGRIYMLLLAVRLQVTTHNLQSLSH
jgi:hypothetical protein